MVIESPDLASLFRSPVLGLGLSLSLVSDLNCAPFSNEYKSYNICKFRLFVHPDEWTKASKQINGLHFL